jgi:hypothetical protein
MSLATLGFHFQASQLRSSSLHSLNHPPLVVQMHNQDETAPDTIAGLHRQAYPSWVTPSLTSLVVPPISLGPPSPLSTHRPPRPPSLHSHRVYQIFRWHNPLYPR